MARKHSHSDYTFAWICALPIELAAAKAVLDETHAKLSASFPGQCTSLGEIEGHNIVLACLPSGGYGTSPAAAVVSHLQANFPNVRAGLTVGIGGGVPSDTADIRLGDVVVSKPTGAYGGVVQYDFGKAVGEGHFQRIGALNYPPPILLAAVSQAEANEMEDRGRCLSETIA